jgi:6-phosphogluconolactonase (cycloisomerase 2 family)
MTRFWKSWGLRPIGLVAGILALSGLGMAGTKYVVTNDDAAFPFPTGASIYAVGANGLPVFQQRVATGGFGIGGGYFGMNRIAVLNRSDQQCVYSTEAGSGNIVGISLTTFTVGGIATGSNTDAGTSNGIGLALNNNYLYASFSDSNTIGTFQIQSGCSLAFVGDTSAVGLGGGGINAMALHSTMLITTYTDGSIESFDISGGTPLSNGDKQASSARVKSQGAIYANSVDITSDGHYALFGDTSTSFNVEISDISSGKLTKTTVYKSMASISSSTVMLSPDESLLYVINTQGASVSALFFDKNAGKLSGGCTSNAVKGLSKNYSYLTGVSLINQTGNGGGVYVAEFGSSSGIAMVTLTSSGKKCMMQEVSGSPVSDINSPGLLSIGTYPPRSF